MNVSLRSSLLLLAGLCTACADDPGSVSISALTLNDAPPGARMRAGYFTLENSTPMERSLVSASSNAFEVVEFHRTEEVDGQSRMRQEQSVTVGPGETVRFERFGRHLMFMQPVSPAVDDTAVSVELCFADGECIRTSVATP
jgi:copper(I)-binding protein